MEKSVLSFCCFCCEGDVPSPARPKPKRGCFQQRISGMETDTNDFEREYVRLPSGISMLAAVTERHCLSPQGEFKREWRRISAWRFTGNAT